MIEVNGVKKQLGSFHMEDITFHLPKGYIMGLIGANGAGKTTLIHLLMGLYKPDEGSVKINRKEASEEEAAVKNEIGYVFNEELFSGDLSLVDNADRYGKYYQNYDKKLLLQYLGQFGLEKKEKLKKYSKGQKLKFQLAFALSHKPKLLLLDEPTGSFDPEFRQQFFKILMDFIADGEHSVVMATHLTRDLERLADYITFIDDGRLIFSLERSALEEKYRLLSGSEEQIGLLDEAEVVYRESGAYGTKALVEHKRGAVYDKELQAEVPSLEDVMYFVLKGKAGEKDAQDGIK